MSADLGFSRSWPPYSESMILSTTSDAYLKYSQLIPKGNSKSPTAAPSCSTAIIFNRRPEAEFLHCADHGDRLDRVSASQRDHKTQTAELTELFHVQDHMRKITHRNSGATLQIKAADTDVITGSIATEHLHLQSPEPHKTYTSRGSLNGGPIALCQGSKQRRNPHPARLSCLSEGPGTT